MRYLIYSLLFVALLAQGEENFSPGEGEKNAAEQGDSAEPAIAAPVEPSSSFATGEYDSLSDDNPAPALPPSDSPAIATTTAVSTDTEVSAGSSPEQVPERDFEEGSDPVDATASLPVPPPVAVEIPAYGPSAEEGYGSVGLKNQGQILEVGRDAEVVPREVVKESGDRKTSSTEEESEEPADEQVEEMGAPESSAPAEEYSL